MTDFWLDNFADLFSINNFSFKGGYIQILNLVALFSIIIGIVLVVITKKPFYFGLVILVLSMTILIKTNIKTDKFSQVVQSDELLTNAFETRSRVIKDISPGSNKIYIDNSLNFNKGDVISVSDGIKSESHVISDVQFTTDTKRPVLILLTDIIGNFSKGNTRILKVSDVSPNIIPPPDGNVSIMDSGAGNTTQEQMFLDAFPKSDDTLTGNNYDWNLELSTYGGLEPGEPPTYGYQGPPYGALRCRESTVNNPMGTINITEYDAEPTMYGTCNVGELTSTRDGKVVNNDYLMTDNQEATVSMRVDDLLFHKGNSQSRYSPMPVDTLPNNQEAFAHFCYINPTNLVNPKYATIFVNDPEKFKLITSLTKAPGTENGGGGGGRGGP